MQMAPLCRVKVGKEMTTLPESGRKILTWAIMSQFRPRVFKLQSWNMLGIVREVPLSFGRLTKIKWKIFVDISLTVLSCLVYARVGYQVVNVKEGISATSSCIGVSLSILTFFLRWWSWKYYKKYVKIKNNLKIDLMIKQNESLDWRSFI